jgi:NAD(P)-dependent dehydrogenase (short-subunit alcohol dehydrogenase family)/MFS family permease
MRARLFSGAAGRVYALLCLMSFIMYVDRVNISVAAPLIRRDIGIGNTALGIALSGFGVCYTLLQLVNGYLGDRFGPREMLSILGLFWSLGTLATGFAGGLSALVFARVLVGLGEAGTVPIATRAMSSWVPRTHRGLAQGIFHMAARLAAAVTPPVMILLISFAGWRIAFAVVGGVGLAWACIWWLYFRDDPRAHRGMTAPALAELPRGEAAKERPGVPWRSLVPRIAPVTLVFFCHAWTLWLFLSWLPSFFMGQYRVDLARSALFTACVFAAGMLGDLAGGWLTDRILRRTGNLNAARRNNRDPGISAIFHLQVARFRHRRFLGDRALSRGIAVLPRDGRSAGLGGADGYRAAPCRDRRRLHQHRGRPCRAPLAGRLRLRRGSDRQLLAALPDVARPSRFGRRACLLHASRHPGRRKRGRPQAGRARRVSGVLRNRVAIVTGAARNIGRAIALELAGVGAAILVGAKTSRKAAEETVALIEAAGGEALMHLADVGDPAAVAGLINAAVSRFGRIDMLINNAAIRRESAFETMSWQEWRGVLSSILDGAFLCSQAALPHLLKSDLASIVNIGGMTGHAGSEGRAHVVAAKAGLAGLTRALAHDLSPKGITVNCVVPGMIATVRDPAAPLPARHRAQRALVGRRGTPEEIAHLVRFLCEPSARYITGQTIHANGGAYLT